MERRADEARREQYPTIQPAVWESRSGFGVPSTQASFLAIAGGLYSEHVTEGSLAPFLSDYLHVFGQPQWVLARIPCGPVHCQQVCPGTENPRGTVLICVFEESVCGCPKRSVEMPSSRYNMHTYTYIHISVCRTEKNTGSVTVQVQVNLFCSGSVPVRLIRSANRFGALNRFANRFGNYK